MGVAGGGVSGQTPWATLPALTEVVAISLHGFSPWNALPGVLSTHGLGLPPGLLLICLVHIWGSQNQSVFFCPVQFGAPRDAHPCASAHMAPAPCMPRVPGREMFTCSALLVTRPCCSLKACSWGHVWEWLFLTRHHWIWRRWRGKGQC